MVFILGDCEWDVWDIFRWEAMNVIACEGSERIERPETYKQWQMRNTRAGFRQLPLNREIVEMRRIGSKLTIIKILLSVKRDSGFARSKCNLNIHRQAYRLQDVGSIGSTTRWSHTLLRKTLCCFPSLLQIQDKYRLIKPGSSVLDLGCAPGAWLQVACQSLGPVQNGGAVIGIDVKNVDIPSKHCDTRVRTVCADVMKLQRRGFDVILSDMCPPVSGITIKDTALSAELGTRALEVAIGRHVLAHEFSCEVNPSASDADDTGVLQTDGHLIIKLLESEEVQGFCKMCKPLFRKTSLLRPKATRPSSREIYLICQNLQAHRPA
ncbi:hypothetical protein MLD38_024150 [Melastoma candidum]|uniref:Uncharacterized protein n=1 Tax=Melastoma candidum TaxID=119954 RepID=A0ACB9NSZ1_9MYRT|nr:hypothetical protein MLD38_024150 [Melastoma candidum]